LRAEAAWTADAKQARRILAIAMVLDGHSRLLAAQASAMDRQTLRDWVHRYETGQGAYATSTIPSASWRDDDLALHLRMQVPVFCNNKGLHFLGEGHQCRRLFGKTVWRRGTNGAAACTLAALVEGGGN
jgi:Helix-turn-helix domain